MAQGVLDLEYSSNSFNLAHQNPNGPRRPQSTPPDDWRGPLGPEKRICVRRFHLFEAMLFLQKISKQTFAVRLAPLLAALGAPFLF